MPFTDAEVEQILRLAGRHPFFIQRACHLLFEEKYTHNSSEVDRGRVNELVYTDLLPHFDATWQLLTAQQQELLKNEAQRTTNQQRKLPECSESSLFCKFLRNKYNAWNLHLTVEELEKVLGKIDDLHALGESELRYLNIVSKRLPQDSSPSTLERGLAIRQVLNEAFERLRGSEIRRDSALDWRLYNLLYYRCFKYHLPHQQIAARLAFSSARQYFRDRGKAIKALLDTLLEMEVSISQDGDE